MGKPPTGIVTPDMLEPKPLVFNPGLVFCKQWDNVDCCLSSQEIHLGIPGASAKKFSYFRADLSIPVAPEPCGPTPSSMNQARALGPTVAFPGTSSFAPGPSWTLCSTFACSWCLLSPCISSPWIAPLSTHGHVLVRSLASTLVPVAFCSGTTRTGVSPDAFINYTWRPPWFHPCDSFCRPAHFRFLRPGNLVLSLSIPGSVRRTPGACRFPSDSPQVNYTGTRHTLGTPLNLSRTDSCFS